MCDCIKSINEFLALENTKIELPIFGPQQPFVSTIKVDNNKRGKPKSVFASCCPFCGEHYPKYQSPFSVKVETLNV